MMEKARREGMRWQLLNVLHKAMPYTTSEQFYLTSFVVFTQT